MEIQVYSMRYIKYQITVIIFVLYLRVLMAGFITMTSVSTSAIPQ